MTVPKPARLRVDNLPTVFPNAAGLDIGSAEMVAALPPDRDVTLVRTFTTFTGDLKQLVTLEGSFRPDDEMCVLRSLLRHRAQLVRV